MQRLRHGFLVGALVLCTTAAAQQQPPPQPPPMSVEQGLKMSRQSEDQSATIASFAQLAAKGDAEGMLAMVDPGMRKSQGDDAIRDAFKKAIIPFFADFQSVDGYEKVTHASLPDGRSGLFHYTYIVTRDGNKKPISIALITDADKVNVLSITVNQCVKDRHPVTKGRCD
jgi:hypothetical protein